MEDWKGSPNPQKGNTSDPSNYRLISVLPVLSKILEKKAVHVQMMKYLESNNLIQIDNIVTVRSDQPTWLQHFFSTALRKK